MKTLYPKTKAQFMQAGANLMTGNIKALLIDTGAYTYDPTHGFLNQVPAGARIATSGALSGKAISDLAEFDSADPIFNSVNGATVEAVILFIDTGDESTSRLIMYQDDSITGAPFTPDGNNVQVVVAANGWFTL
jgi:hypothetical protein